MSPENCTVRVSNIPYTAIARELFSFFESSVAPNSVYACEIFSERKNWKSRGLGRVQFEAAGFSSKAQLLSAEGKLEFQRSRLILVPSFDDIIFRPAVVNNRFSGGTLHAGFLSGESCMIGLESWRVEKAELMPEKNRLQFWVFAGEREEECYKLEIPFGDLVGVIGCGPRGGKHNTLLLKVKYAPRIYQKISGPTLATKFDNDRYHFCRDDIDFLWVRTSDFSKLKSIGQSSCFCWVLSDGSLDSEYVTGLPYYEELENLTIRQGNAICPASELVPIIIPSPNSKLDYDIFFQLNSLIHFQKIGMAAVNDKLIDFLNGLNVETLKYIFRKLHKVKSTCYEPMKFIQQLNSRRISVSVSSASNSMLLEKNLMICYRVLVTPSKVFFLGPELETSNYIVKHHAEFASDFLRVSFVEEDWTKLPPDSISTRIDNAIFSEPYRTRIYDRILAVLRDGIVIGSKRFEFLAFSASQLRSSSVWMFASNNNMNAKTIRQWMGCFSKIRSVSKCAARMGQLFSTSLQTFTVPKKDVETIPDIETETDGIKYCFSDGIGKISLFFARQVAQKCGLNKIPSAFQIRYGGYKGVITIDRTSFRNLSLRQSMLKFDSRNTMLCVTKWTESMPCFLNREIITLLSTLGVPDESFELIQEEQMRLLDGMLTNKDSALNVLDGISGGNPKAVLTKMLLQGYEPNQEPFLSMMLKALYDYQLCEIRSRCRIFVPKGRVLFGCLDETGSLDYGQVYVRVTLTRSELEEGGQHYFQRIDEKTSVVVGKVIVTKNPCLHPGDIRVLEAVYNPELEDSELIDCVLFPQRGKRPHPNECSGGDLDGDLYFVCWDENLVPSATDKPMDYFGRKPRIMDHEVTLEEIQRFFVDYMIHDTLGAISTAHLIHADREPKKARSPKCLQLSNLHSMAVDFAKTGAPAEMPRIMKPREYPDFLERTDRPMYASPGVIGKLYRAVINHNKQRESIRSEAATPAAYDDDLIVPGLEEFLAHAERCKNQYAEKLSSLMNYFGAECEDEILLGNLRKRSAYLQRDNRRYNEVKDRILVAAKSLQEEALGWFKSECKNHERSKMASAWYHVTYHPAHSSGTNFLSFPWTVGDVLLNIKSSKIQEKLNRAA